MYQVILIKSDNTEEREALFFLVGFPRKKSLFITRHARRVGCLYFIFSV